MAPEVDVRFAPEAPQCVIIGILGAFIGSWLLRQLVINLGTGLISAISNATIGAVLVLLILRTAPQGGTGGSGGGVITGRLRIVIGLLGRQHR